MFVWFLFYLIALLFHLGIFENELKIWIIFLRQRKWVILIWLYNFHFHCVNWGHVVGVTPPRSLKIRAFISISVPNSHAAFSYISNSPRTFPYRIFVPALAWLMRLFSLSKKIKQINLLVIIRDCVHFGAASFIHTRTKFCVFVKYFYYKCV